MREFLCKYGLILFLMVAISILAIQKESIEDKTIVKQNTMIPDQTVVISAILRSGKGIPVIIVKGLLNPENEGKKWITLENFIMKQLKYNKRKSKIDNKHTFEVNKGEK